MAVQDALFPSLGPSAVSVWQNPGRTPDVAGPTITTVDAPSTTLSATSVAVPTTVPAPVVDAVATGAVDDGDDNDGPAVPSGVATDDDRSQGSGDDGHSGAVVTPTTAGPDDDPDPDSDSDSSGSGSTGGDRSGSSGSGSGSSGSGSSGSGSSGSGSSGSGSPGGSSLDDPEDPDD